jgi:hypothetical protein
VIDYLGATLLALATTSLVLMTSLAGTTSAWGSVPITTLGVAGVLLIALFAAAERRATEPVLPLTTPTGGDSNGRPLVPLEHGRPMRIPRLRSGCGSSHANSAITTHGSSKPRRPFARRPENRYRAPRAGVGDNAPVVTRRHGEQFV